MQHIFVPHFTSDAETRECMYFITLFKKRPIRIAQEFQMNVVSLNNMDHKMHDKNPVAGFTVHISLQGNNFGNSLDWNFT